MGTTLNPAVLSRREIEAVVMPFPRPEITPPDMKIYFRCILHCTIYYRKMQQFDNFRCFIYNRAYEQRNRC